MFQRRQVTPNVACASAMQRSVQHAHSSPPAYATPLTAAIVGFARSVQRVGPIIPGRSPRTCAARSASETGTTSSPANASLRSPPAQNASSPAPVRMPTSASSSSRNRVHAAISSRATTGPMAFIRSGRSIVMTVTGPSCS